NKFRAPSMIMVIPTFVLCMMAVASFDTILKYEDKEELWKKLKKGFIVVAAVFAIALLVYMSSDFMGEADKALSKQISQIQDPQQKESLTQPVHTFISALKEDRKDLFMGSLFRSFLFILVPVIAIFLFVKNKVNSLVAIVAVGLFSFIDVMSIDVKYMNEEHFQDDNDTETVFKKTDADQQILKDTGYYRVFNLTQGAQAAFNQGALNSYYHKSIGGYHPAKLSIYQDLIEHQLYNFPNCMPVLNMLNAKYVVTPGQQQGGQPVAQLNPGALGACWFVKGIAVKKTPNEVMDCLTTFDTKDSAVIFEADKALATAAAQFDSTAKVSLVNNDNDFIEYKSSSKINQFAVFSEVYYRHGWKAYIDGKETPIVKTNYVLRGLSVPAGDHKITFEFKPDSYYGSMKASVASSVIMWLLLFSACFMFYKKSKD
ncbi:MAG: YfhO family protein, partial [Bacteroidota bacterium]